MNSILTCYRKNAFIANTNFFHKQPFSFNISSIAINFRINTFKQIIISNYIYSLFLMIILTSKVLFSVFAGYHLLFSKKGYSFSALAFDRKLRVLFSFSPIIKIASFKHYSLNCSYPTILIIFLTKGSLPQTR